MGRIPKTIHYCWFGKGEKTELIKMCINSWYKFCPDYQIVEWNETTFDVESNCFVSEAYKAGKWAFVSDYVRLWALYNYGGVYLDSDVELKKSIDVFLEDCAFTGFESKDSPVTAVMGCIKGHPLYKELLEYYSNRHFIINGQPDLTTNVSIITNILVKHGIKLNNSKQTVCACTIYPEVVFCPNNIARVLNRDSRKTYAVHHFAGSWGLSQHTQVKRSFIQRFRMYIVHILRNTIGSEKTSKIGLIIKKSRG